MSTNEKIHKGSGNVFADAGLPNAAEHHLKAKLVLKILGI